MLHSQHTSVQKLLHAVRCAAKLLIHELNILAFVHYTYARIIKFVQM